MKKLLILSAVAVLFAACNKEPGKGGTSTITGKVYRYEVNVLGQVLAEYYPADKDVYIQYGTDDEIYDDKFSTSHDGSYEFTGLTRGTYTVFTYTRCDTCESGETIVSETIEITEKKTTYSLDDLESYK